MGEVFLALLALSLAAARAAVAGDMTASAPTSLSVTLYRAPYRNGGSINLDHLGGFALVTETRTIHLPVGESRLRFEGVVDGIEPASAIVGGLPDGVIEKNQDAALLSPSALLNAVVGAEVTLARTNRKTGKTTLTPAVIRSANGEGVVFQTAEGVEALRCSGASETFAFSRVPAGLSSTPTLSVLTRANRAVTATVTLSYIADGFDWAANYVATLRPGGEALDLGAWITLANGNGVGLPGAHAQIVAGRLNRIYQGQAASGEPPTVIARCWPQGTTSDVLPPESLTLAQPFPQGSQEIGEIVVTGQRRFSLVAYADAAAPLPPPPPPEQLGDLKLYRLPAQTTVASRQSKQVRLLDKVNIPCQRLATADLMALAAYRDFQPATILLRTKNDIAHNLGLPLPSGRVAVFGPAGDRELLIGSADLRDTAKDEEVELRLGPMPDVQVRQEMIRRTAAPPELFQISPEFALAITSSTAIEAVEITNARDAETPFELRLRTTGTQRVSAADRPMTLKDGRPLFQLTLPAHGKITVHYTLAPN